MGRGRPRRRAGLSAVAVARLSDQPRTPPAAHATNRPINRRTSQPPASRRGCPAAGRASGGDCRRAPAVCKFRGRALARAAGRPGVYPASRARPRESARGWLRDWIVPPRSARHARRGPSRRAVGVGSSERPVAADCALESCGRVLACGDEAPLALDRKARANCPLMVWAWAALGDGPGGGTFCWLWRVEDGKDVRD